MAKKHVRYGDLAVPVKQPKGGWQHPRHLIGFNTKQTNTKWSFLSGYRRDNTVCISPSVSYYSDLKKNVSFSVEEYDPRLDTEYKSEPYIPGPDAKRATTI